MEKHIDAVKGGRGKDDTAASLARKHSVFIGTIEKEIELGKEVEKEHSSNPEIILDIVFDHLAEFPDYYSNKKYGLNANEKKLEKVNEDEERLRPADIGDFFKDVESAKDCNDLESIKKYYNQTWFNRLPEKFQNRVSKAMMNQVNRMAGGSAKKPKNMRETIIKNLRLITEDTGLSITDQTPTELVYNINADGKKAGEIVVQTQHKDLGKDTMEILDLKFDKDHSDIKTAVGGINSIWKLHPTAMRIVVSPADNTLAFWTKLGFSRLNNDYLILNRNHNLSQV
jgi:hypothetical protein